MIGHVRYVHHKVDQITDYLKDMHEILREIHDATVTENGTSWYDLYPKVMHHIENSANCSHHDQQTCNRANEEVAHTDGQVLRGP